MDPIIPVWNVIPVWHSNFKKEVHHLQLSLNRYKVLCVDTEFPGFLRNTPRYAPAAVVYDDVKFNVDRMNIIQLGVTLMDYHGNTGPTWEFNFQFDLDKETYVESSVLFLKNGGLNFERTKQEGIPRNIFLDLLKIIGTHHDLTWVTFHGIYDIAYILKLFTNEPLPATARGFAAKSSYYFAWVLDVKFAAKHCEGLKDMELGLAKLARIVKVKRYGEAHNAGSDSLLTAHVFARMMDDIGDGRFEGILYGLEDFKIGRMYCPIVIIRHGPHPLGPHPHPWLYWHGHRVQLPLMQARLSPPPYMQPPMIMLPLPQPRYVRMI